MLFAFDAANVNKNVDNGKGLDNRKGLDNEKSTRHFCNAISPDRAVSY